MAMSVMSAVQPRITARRRRSTLRNSRKSKPPGTAQDNGPVVTNGAYARSRSGAVSDVVRALVKVTRSAMGDHSAQKALTRSSGPSRTLLPSLNKALYSLKKPLWHAHHVARKNASVLADRLLRAGIGRTSDHDMASIGPRRISPRQSDRVQHGQAVDIGVATRFLHFAQNVKRPVIENFHSDARINQVILAVALRDQGFRLLHGLARNPHGPDQRQGDKTLVIDVEISRQIFLAENRHAQLIADAQFIRCVCRPHRRPLQDQQAGEQ